MGDNPLNHSPSESAVPGNDFGARLIVEAIDAFNLAAWHNAVPLLRKLAIDNAAGDELANVVVEAAASPPFIRPKRWLVDRVPAGDVTLLRNLDLEIDNNYLDRLDEAERGILTFKLLRGEQPLHEARHELRVLARDEWGGMGTMGELLPAFVTPNDPALVPLLKSAAEALAISGHSSALDGYQSGDRNRSYLLAASLWSAVAARSLTYANPPGSFERVGQKTRRVETVLADGLATCLDSTLLFASALEAIGLNPIIVMTQGHCFAGVWLVERTGKRLVEPDCSELRKAIAARELTLFETTLVTNNPPGRFPDAVTTAEAAVAEAKEHEFVAAIDVRRARMSQVLPLASHSERQAASDSGSASGPLPLPNAPGFATLPAVTTEERPQTPAGRIERWQRKLLDLSMRNRLLNFRPTKQTVPVLCPDVSRLEDLLAEGARMRLVSLVDDNVVGQRDAELHHKRTQKDLDWEFARQALGRNEVACPVDGRDLDVRLTALDRKVRNDLAEGGSNTLYLAVGFLRWKQTPADEKTYRAPLILAPIKLSRRSASSPFYLTSHEDDVRFNATLLQMLKKDFACDLTAFETELPTDDSGVDVPLVLERMRQAVRDIPGFEVVEEAAIATFSFAKYLMWKDLVDRVSQLENNRVVRHLIREPDKPFVCDAGPMPQPHELDVRYKPVDIVHPLPADSSQLAAVMAASEGHDLVIVGPPGTGKSQTIANLIAQCLAVGKTVLFVAEKTAALDVVHRRLREHGLGDCCVELHSNKAERRRFLDQLDASWKTRVEGSESAWVMISDRLRIRRDQLNSYAAALHTPEPNGWTPYRAMGLSVKGRDAPAPALTWPRDARHDRDALETLRSTVHELAAAFQAIEPHSRLLFVQATRWSVSWEQDLLEACRNLQGAAGALKGSLESFAGMLQESDLVDVSSAQLTQLFRLCQELARDSVPPIELVLHEHLNELELALKDRRQLLERRRTAQDRLAKAFDGFRAALGVSTTDGLSETAKSSYYRLANALVQSDPPPAELVFHSDFARLSQCLSERPAIEAGVERAAEALAARSFSAALVERIQFQELDDSWAQACKSFWPLSLLKKKALVKRIKAYMTADGVPAPEIDLPLLREHAASKNQLAENLSRMGLAGALEAAVVDADQALPIQLEAAAKVRESFKAAGLEPVDVARATGGNYGPLVSAARLLYPPAREIEAVRKQLAANLSALELPPHLQEAVEVNADALQPAIQAARRMADALAGIGVPRDRREQAARSALAASQRRTIAADCCRRAKVFQEAWIEYTRRAGAMPAAADSRSVITDAAEQSAWIPANRTALKQWTAWLDVRAQAEKLGLSPFIDAIQAGDVDRDNVGTLFDVAYARWWLPAVVDRREPLRVFQKYQHEDAIEDFRRLDEQARRAAAPRARRTAFHGLPPSDQVPRQSELGLLRHQMGLKRPSKSIREVISGMPQTFGKLAPCLLMSPLSIAQYLPADQAQFDVVVFDEASQIATWDAIGAIARGRQTIIVGDPKQLPPTNFFGRADSDDGDEQIEEFEKDLESILDEAQASGLPTLQLNWHYRSRHESLIAFSNYYYYGNHLVTFPAAESADRGVSLRHVPGALYDRGKSRTNRQEAEAIVADAVQRMKRCLRKPEGQRLTYGVVTFNSQQQELIQDLFDDAQRREPALEWFFSDDRIEPTAVKNLENVQGDERDVMMFSITFGYDAAGKFPIDFGAINREGGERRLNVAVTRARQELAVYASFLPEQLRSERSSARGVHHLKAFLEYAVKGPTAIVAQTTGSVGEAESPLEEAVAAALAELGWQVEPQIGVSGFRIDLGIVHPDKPGAYLAGVECDGATYHRSAVARDRDKTRQQVLEQLGWNIVRVWSTDWWYDPIGALKQIDAALDDHLARSRSSEVPSESADDQQIIGAENSQHAVVDESVGDAAVDRILTVKASDGGDPSPCDSSQTEQSLPQLIAKRQGLEAKNWYDRARLPDGTGCQDRFYDEGYSEELKRMAMAVLAAEAPIRDEALAREVARAHGFARTGNRIKQRVLDLLPSVVATQETVGTFLWSSPSVPASIPFRFPRPDDERRSVDEIPIQELLGLIRERPNLLASDDPALTLAREIGLARLAQGARARLEAAVEISGRMSHVPDVAS